VWRACWFPGKGWLPAPTTTAVFGELRLAGLWTFELARLADGDRQADPARV